MRISETTRRNIFDTLRLEKIPWYGRLDEINFLARLYDLDNLPSNDVRFNSMRRDIQQHRVNNDDWEIDWVFDDDRLSLLKCEDDRFLKFLCEMAHPIVRNDQSEVIKIINIFNDYLRKDGIEIVAEDLISGHPIFVAQHYIAGANHHSSASSLLKNGINSTYVDNQIKRLQESIESDPELAIGTAKEFVETICKTILDEKHVTYNRDEDLPKLVRITLKQLKLAPEDISDSSKAVDTIRIMLQNLASISNGLSELRNPYGTGHGKHARSKGLEARHARLAVGSAITLSVFIFETYTKQKYGEK